MSAFLCSDRHLAAIVHAWIVAPRPIGVRITPGVYLEPTNHEDWQRFMDALYAANVRSVRHRYADATAPDEAPVYRDSKAPNVTGLALVKLLDSYDYQACEVPNYHETPIARAVDELRRRTIAGLPEYGAAEWAI
jgi:hypothetical protein